MVLNIWGCNLLLLETVGFHRLTGPDVSPVCLSAPSMLPACLSLSLCDTISKGHATSLLLPLYNQASSVKAQLSFASEPRISSSLQGTLIQGFSVLAFLML